jgi:L,D-peptidoglycan transpeptidase YkuD (ErfK/YbiS/YcfS/YnhG family)
MRRRAVLALTTVATCVAAMVMLALPGQARAVGSCPGAEIRVYKAEGALELWCGGALARAMAATFGANPVGPKRREGDERTPEGEYTITSRERSARFYRFLRLSYPNPEDQRRARAEGVANPGGAIGIHGVTPRLSALARAWIRLAAAARLSGVWGPTDGCIGVSNEDVGMLYDAVPVGARVLIVARR